MHRTIYIIVLFFVAAFALPLHVNLVQKPRYNYGDIVGVWPDQYDESYHETKVGHSPSQVQKDSIIFICNSGGIEEHSYSSCCLPWSIPPKYGRILSRDRF